MDILHNTAVLLAAFTVLFMALMDPDKITILTKFLIMICLYGGSLVAAVTTMISIWA